MRWKKNRMSNMPIVCLFISSPINCLISCWKSTWWRLYSYRFSNTAASALSLSLSLSLSIGNIFGSTFCNFHFFFSVIFKIDLVLMSANWILVDTTHQFSMQCWMENLSICQFNWKRKTLKRWTWFIDIFRLNGFSRGLSDCQFTFVNKNGFYV